MVSPAAQPLTHVAVPQPEPETMERRKSRPNVGEMERVASIMAGSMLVASGVKHALSARGLIKAFVGYRMIHRGATGQCQVYKALNVTSRNEGEGFWNSKTLTHPLHQHIRVEKVVSVNKPVEEVFKFWRNVENLPKFMDHLERVEKIDDKRSRWTAKAPRDQQVSWEATIVEEEENKRIAWKSSEGAKVPNSGQVIFKPISEGRGTEVKVLLAYDPPAGIFGELYAKFFGEEPAQQIHEDLRHFKQIMETGERPRIGGQPQGHCAGHH